MNLTELPTLKIGGYMSYAAFNVSMKALERVAADDNLSDDECKMLDLQLKSADAALVASGSMLDAYGEIVWGMVE